MDVHKYDRDEDGNLTKSDQVLFNSDFRLGVMMIGLAGYWTITWLQVGVRYLSSL